MYGRAEKLDQRDESDKNLHAKRAASLTRDTQLEQVKARDATYPDPDGIKNQTKHANTAKTKLTDATKSAADAHKSMEWYTNIMSARRELSQRNEGDEPQQKKANSGPRRCEKLSCLAFCRIILPFLTPIKDANDIHIQIYIYIHIHICIHIHIPYACTHTCLHEHIHIYIHIHLLHIHIYSHTQI
jgi:hypothetical protein